MAFDYKLLDRKQGELTVSDATPTTLVSYAVPASSIVKIEARIEMESTSGGSANSVWSTFCGKTWKNVSGTVTRMTKTNVGTTTDFAFNFIDHDFSNPPTIATGVSSTNATITITGNGDPFRAWYYMDIYVLTP